MIIDRKEVDKHRRLLLKESRKIQDKDIIDLVEQAFYAADPRFFTCAASSSGRYHPVEDNGPGGTVRHVIKAAAVAYELSRFYSISDKERDIAVAGALLHDICKNGDPWTDRTDHEHGIIGYDFLGQFDLAEPDREMIRNAVRYHMGQWVQPESEKTRALQATAVEHIVQLSDYFASRKCASFLPGLELNDYLIDGYADYRLK